MNTQVGDDIRALRKSRGMTLQQLAEAVGRSAGWLSLIERGNADPAIRDLEQIAALFGVNISFFFRSASREAAERGLILRAADRVPLGSSDSGLVEELLSPVLSGSFEMIKSTFAPQSDSGPPRPPRPREDGGLLLSGQLTLILDGEAFALSPGDSFQFAGKPYGWRNEGDTPAVVIWIVSPPIY
ncbi:helix-turn-helix domain-containing protein [Pseudooceanicola sp. CBS1P-1]|uniref:Helix-turn-helix domain-containing protein n=2 Tax=Paracoccaceae TaxID=31989 RepID=A0A6L7G5Z8_9RHOB|nr:helix-turn-helix domain-containing protein [Pseudooceanicola endophyticus]MXN18898.1 helix-turn-helix domain-containing protein [Pseudooceanicola albus]